MYAILIGGGETMYYLARQLQQENHKLTIINRKYQHCQELVERTQATVIHGDGSNRVILEEAGARKADVLLALTPYDQDNLVACQIAQKLYSVPRTIALVNDPDNEEIFEQLGVTSAFSSTRIIAQLIEQQTHIDDIKRLIPVGDGQIHLTDIRINQQSPIVGKALKDLDLGKQILIASIIREDNVIIPHGDDKLEVGDHIIVINNARHTTLDLATLAGENQE